MYHIFIIGSKWNGDVIDLIYMFTVEEYNSKRERNIAKCE